MGGMDAMASTPKLSAWAASSWESAVLGNHRQLALGFGHDVLQNHLAFFLALVNALTGGAANVNALDALLDKIPGQRPNAFGTDVAFAVIAGVESRNNALILFCVGHKKLPQNKNRILR